VSGRWRAGTCRGRGALLSSRWCVLESRTSSIIAGGFGLVARSYWLDLFTGTTWEEFLAAGGEVSGFRERRWRTVQQMKPGDYLLCYLTGISRWIGVLEVVSEPFKDHTPIWKDEEFPCRVRVRAVVVLTPATAVPVFELRDQLSVFGDSKNPRAWTGHFRGSPMRWKSTDGQAVVAAIADAEDHPITRPVDAAKLARRPRAQGGDRSGDGAGQHRRARPAAGPGRRASGPHGAHRAPVESA
jgi:hypothetical protein